MKLFKTKNKNPNINSHIANEEKQNEKSIITDIGFNSRIMIDTVNLVDLLINTIFHKTYIGYDEEEEYCKFVTEGIRKNILDFYITKNYDIRNIETKLKLDSCEFTENYETADTNKKYNRFNLITISYFIDYFYITITMKNYPIYPEHRNYTISEIFNDIVFRDITKSEHNATFIQYSTMFVTADYLHYLELEDIRKSKKYNYLTYNDIHSIYNNYIKMNCFTPEIYKLFDFMYYYFKDIETFKGYKFKIYTNWIDYVPNVTVIDADNSISPSVFLDYLPRMKGTKCLNDLNHNLNSILLPIPNLVQNHLEDV